jgi:hypothetical protein
VRQLEGKALATLAHSLGTSLADPDDLAAAA